MEVYHRRLTIMIVWFAALLSVISITPVICQAQKPQLVVQIGHSGAISTVAFSRDGKTIASCSSDLRSYRSSDFTIKLWDTATGLLLRTLTGNNNHYVVTSLAFSPDQKTLVSTGTYPDDVDIPSRKPFEVVIFWDTATGKELHSITTDEVGHSYYCLCFSPDGKTLAGGSAYEGIKIWDAATGEELNTIHRSIMSRSAMAFSADGRSLAVHGSVVGNTVDVLDVATGNVLRTLTADTKYVDELAFSPDGETAALGCSDNTIEILDVATGKKLSTLTGHTKDILSIAFSPDGKTIASSSQDNTLKLWNSTTGKELRTLPGDTQKMSGVAFSPDGITLAAGGPSSTIKRWIVATGQELPSITGTEDEMHSIAFSPDSRTLASSNRENLTGKDTLKFWDTAEGQGFRIFSEHVSPMYFMSFSPDGKTLASQSDYWTMNIWDIDTSKTPHSIEAYFLHALDDGTAPIPNYLKPLTPRNMTDISPDGRVLAYAGQGDFMFFDTRMRFGGLNIPSDSDNEITLLDIAHPYYDSPNMDHFYNYPELHTLIGHTDRVISVAFSPNGATLASGDAHGIIKIWNTATGQELHTLAGHTSGVNSVSFSPDGKTLASASNDGSLKLWDTATGQELGSLYSTGYTDWTIVTPDGRFDSYNLDNIQNVHWVLPDQPLTPVPVEAFFAQYYTPGLLAHLLHRDPLPPLPDIGTINHVQPTVTIDKVEPRPGDDPALADVTISCAGQQADAIQPDGTTKTETSGVYDLRLFRNGQLVAALPENAAPGAAPTDLSGGTVGKTTSHTFTVRLARDGAKTVTFTAYAFNSQKVKSPTASLDYTPTAALPSVKGRAWVIAFGVNAYQDPHWNLHFAAADARVFGTQVVPSIEKTGQYSQVKFVPLISDTTPSTDELPATKAALRATLDTLAGKANSQDAPFAPLLQKLGVTKVMPEDLLVLAFSCHGDADSKTGEYYLFPTDIGPDQSRGLTPDLEAHAVSSAELTAWMQGVDAGEMAMVIDSCHSAAAAGEAFKPGPMDSPGLGQLAYYKRMRILSASAADAVAKEYPDLGHGLLTAALVRDGLVKGEAKPAPGTSALTVGPWLTFAEGDVTALDARENGLKLPKPPDAKGAAGAKGTELTNGGTDNPTAGLQRPSLFDFHRQGSPDAVISPTKPIP